MRENAGTKDFSLISKHRSVLMGTAILLIMFCHLDVAQRHNRADITRLALILQTGSVGVDIFLFLSGVGLYYSYTKHKLPYLSFEKKRMLRLLPAYCIIGGLTYLIYDILMQHYSVWRFLSDFFFVSWPCRGSTRYWYIIAITVLYFLFPLLYRLIHGGKNRLIPLLLFCVLWWFAGETICLKYNSISTFRMAISRLPIFSFGIFCGALAFQKKKVNKYLLLPFVFSGFISLIVLRKLIPQPFYTYLYYPVRALLALSIIATVILAMEHMEKKIPWMNKSFTVVLPSTTVIPVLSLIIIQIIAISIRATVENLFIISLLMICLLSPF